MNQEAATKLVSLLPNSSLQLSVFRSFDEAQPAWLALESTADCYAFQTYAWLKNWYDCIGAPAGVTTCITLVETPQGEPVMLLPLGIERRGPAVCLVWLGGRISDYHGPLLAQNCSRILDRDRFAGIWPEIRRRLPRHDAVALERQPEFIGSHPNPFLGLPCIPNASSAHYTQLGDSAETFLQARRGSRWLSGERRKERRLGEHGVLGYRVSTSPQDVKLLLPEMMVQKSQSYREMGVRDLFAEVGYRRFVGQLSERYARDGFVHLSALTLDDRILATLWGLVYKERFYHLFPTYARGELTRYSPGNSLLRRVFEWCIANRVRIYDFTIGDEAYKDDWCDQELRLFDSIYATTARGWCYAAAARLARRAKLRIKRSAPLWRLARLLRAAMARLRRE